MLIEIDFNSEEALYLQVRNQIIHGIATLQLQEGDELPSVRQMADEIGIPLASKENPHGIKVVATGGLSRVIVPECRHDIIVDHALLLKGLKIIYDKNVE